MSVYKSVKNPLPTAESLTSLESPIINGHSSKKSVALDIFIGCLPQILTKDDLFGYFSKFGVVKSLELEEKVPNKDDPDVNSDSCLVNAKLSCSTEMMYSTILENSHRIYCHNIKVSKYMTAAELNSYVEKSRNCRIYIKKLPQEITNERLEAIFAKYGKIEKAYCVVGSKVRKYLKYGYVFFSDELSVHKLPPKGLYYKGQLLAWTSFLNKQEKKES
jgi:RNA recognition motif-containing protein